MGRLERTLLLGALLILVSGVDSLDFCHSFPFCKYCPVTDGRARCTQCHVSFALRPEMADSTPCSPCRDMPGCWLCSNTTRCELCQFPNKDGPDLNGYGTCSPCAPNCMYCMTAGSGKCDKNACKPGFFLNSNQQCTACLPNCTQCTDVSTCQFCFQGSFLKQNTKTCTPCPKNCADCTTAGICKKCTVGKISASGSCQCSDNCDDCTGSGFGLCNACKNGYKLGNDKTCTSTNDR